MLDRLRSEIRNEPIVLAHHPLCGRYEDHFITIGNKKLCRGCLTVYPSAMASIVLITLAGINDFFVLFYASMFLFAANLPRLFLCRTGRTNFLFNVVLGLCLSATLLAVVNCPEQLRAIYYPFVLSSYLLFMGYRGFRLLSACRTCPDHRLYPACVTTKRTSESRHDNLIKTDSIEPPFV